MAVMGFRTDIPQAWNRIWLVMWLVFSGVLIYLAFIVAFWPDWVLATIPLFFIPEIISIWRQNDSFPPLTHTIRHFLPNWAAFPLIYFLLGSIGARALGFDYPRNLHVGGLFGLLGWLTDHFAVTYREPDPFPFSRAEQVTSENAEPRGLTL
jgi:hypothetical protein